MALSFLTPAKIRTRQGYKNLSYLSYLVCVTRSRPWRLFRQWRPRSVGASVKSNPHFWLPHVSVFQSEKQTRTHIRRLICAFVFLFAIRSIFRDICSYLYKQQHDIMYLMICAPSEDSNQPAHLHSLIRDLAVRPKKTKLGPWLAGERPAKTQIRLRFCAVWYESSLCTNDKVHYLMLRLTRRSYIWGQIKKFKSFQTESCRITPHYPKWSPRKILENEENCLPVADSSMC